MPISVIKKRDGRIVPFDMKKISDAIEKSFRADTGRVEREAIADQLAWEVTTLLVQEGNPAPTVERIQDLVEQVLMNRGYLAAAKRYILYRQARTDIRARGGQEGGTVVLEPWEPTLTGEAVAICAAIRPGTTRLLGFYEALAPAAEQTLLEHYETALGTTLSLRAGCRVSLQTLRSMRRAMTENGYILPGPGQAAWLSRQADLICGALGCDREPVEQAQAAALELAELQTNQLIRQTLRCLHARGCLAEMIAPPEQITPAAAMVLEQED